MPAASRYDALIVGAGLSGLAAGLRLAHFGRRVLICEAHTKAGGLSSWFRRQGRDFDTALHAITNYAPPGRDSRALTVLLRQLRLRREDLDLVEQSGSRIAFPGCSLRFGNDLDLLCAEVAARFPSEADGFGRLCAFVQEYRETDLDAPVFAPAREAMGRFLRDPLLMDMLLCPLMYYGNSREDDMDLTQFALIWKAVYASGFAMPRRGMRPLVDLLERRFRESGGEIRFGCAVARLETEGGRVRAARLESGEEIAADRVFSCAGLVETHRLCSDQPADALDPAIGRISLVEIIARLDQEPRELGCEDTIVFFCREPRLRFHRPDGLVDAESGVICVPGNYRHEPRLADRVVRFSVLANYERWRAILGTHDSASADPACRGRYHEAKQWAAREVFASADGLGMRVRDHATCVDVFTPLTIERYTRHRQGALYGSPEKRRRGQTPYANLFLIGADQGYLGIVGAMLSGITMANLHGLRNNAG